MPDKIHGELNEEDHAPWSYTEFGVLCMCGSAMRDEECLWLAAHRRPVDGEEQK